MVLCAVNENNWMSLHNLYNSMVNPVDPNREPVGVLAVVVHVPEKLG